MPSGGSEPRWVRSPYAFLFNTKGLWRRRQEGSEEQPGGAATLTAGRLRGL